MAATFNVAAACQYAASHAYPKSKHLCATYVENAIQAGGLPRPSCTMNGGNGYAESLHYKGTLKQMGWGLIKAGVVAPSSNISGQQNGDVVILSLGYGVSKSNHIAMWCGTNWVSDFKQNNCNIYGSKPYNYFLYRYGVTSNIDVGNLDFSSGVTVYDSNGVASFIQNGNYEVVEKREEQPDNIAINGLTTTISEILSSCILDDCYGTLEAYKKPGVQKLNPKKLIKGEKEYNQVVYRNEIADNGNVSVSESVASKLLFKMTDGMTDGVSLGFTSIDGLAGGEQMNITGETINADWGFASKNVISMMVGTCEGWSDKRAKYFLGVPGTPAMAGNQSAIDRGGVITVGPGLTNALNGILPPALKIVDGKMFSGQQIMSMYSITIKDACNQIYRLNPNLRNLPQGVKDAAIDCFHSGIKHWINAGWKNVKTPQDAAAACDRMPKTAKGKINKQLSARREAEAAICLGVMPRSSKAIEMANAYYHPISKIVNLL